ncbi:hypothetical protein Asd1617_02135 [Shigella dysenteriae 1617]|uniref:Uncharacterized protein n=1 Tax=Shigella dysenteriae 1617 TaxID=754093 RepID=A0A0A6ZSJ3_SHIDY|nr:hypothetical protein Asd1617_02135 [Shigella dysenteriae 1617]
MFLRWGNNHHIATGSNERLLGLFRNALRGKENKRAAIADKSGFIIASVTLSRFQLAVVMI